jgi:hypothetical protein
MAGKKNFTIPWLIKYIHAGKNKCSKMKHAECPFFHSKDERRNLNDISLLEMPVLTNLKYNPNKVYIGNVNHLRELELIKQRAQEMKNIQSHGYQHFPNCQMFPSQYMMQSQQSYPEQNGMMYNQPQYPVMQEQRFCGSPPLGYYPSPAAAKTNGVKKKSKLSTKSPHAITGHKLVRKNTDFVPSRQHSNLLPGQQERVQTPEMSVNYANFGQAVNSVSSYQRQEGGYSPNYYQEYPQYSSGQTSYYRKSTFDESEYYKAQAMASPYSSPEEFNMQMRMSQSFQLRPFLVGQGPDQEDSGYFQPNLSGGSHISKKLEEAKDEEEFNYFEPFSEENNSFQNEERRSPSSGPIFNLLSQKETEGVLN